ncbi:MAG: alpha/beta fold hydrolase [Alphaproteobacteria bacterium]|nr:alpha/beta fold hydrolase [Alphaproteobacteria bacterium]
MILRAVEAGEGPSLILLHGLFGSAQNFATVQRKFAKRFRCIALDLRNHGGSPHDAAMSYGGMAVDVLDTLADRTALPAMLVGHSMGGKVAMRLALDRPDATRRLIVADIAPVPYRPAFRDLAAAMQALPLTPGLTRASADAHLAAAVPDPGLRAFLLQNLRVGAQPSWRIGLAEIASALPVIEGWDAPDGAMYPGPTLFVAGARSDYIRPDHRPAIRALFPTARFVTVKDAGHWVHAENPAGFVGVVEAFLSA